MIVSNSWFHLGFQWVWQCRLELCEPSVRGQRSLKRWHWMWQKKLRRVQSFGPKQPRNNEMNVLNEMELKKGRGRRGSRIGSRSCQTSRSRLWVVRLGSDLKWRSASEGSQAFWAPNSIVGDSNSVHASFFSCAVAMMRSCEPFLNRVKQVKPIS